ncbi:MAG: glycosyltransferase [Prosthecobacter sp.]|uniref:glycosyltransferase n=1 Tax=Prosthecobacter sp. TaxID=1965333 RepID=UPI0025EEC2CB|nr:glycosyltransferase [Prosthecobacter sp.]MCF7785117.1 glycosyltransferase [Prosthecobacter sp.]
MSTEKLSVLIPILNGAPFLEEALVSLEQQTHRDFEVLVWDNGSTDGTLEILDRWIPARLPGRIYRGQPLSLGLSLARLVEVATTELCARMDADDICHPDRFRQQLDFHRQHPTLALVGTDRDCIDMAGNKLEGASTLPFTPTEVLHATLVGPRIWHPTVLFKRSAILQAGNYQDHSSPAEPYWSEDYDMWMRLLTHHLAATMPEHLLRYRINPEGVTQKAMKEKRAALARRRVWERHAAAFTGLDSSTALRLHDRTCRFALPALWRMARHFQRLDGLPPFARLRHPSFHAAMDKLISRQDLTARLWLKACRSLQPAPADAPPTP